MTDNSIEAKSVINDIKVLLDSYKVVYDILDQLPVVLSIKNEKLETVYCTRFFALKYLYNRGFNRSDYYGHSDYEVFPTEMAFMYVKNDKAVLKTEAAEIFEEPVIVDRKRIIEKFVKLVLLINKEKHVVSMQVSGDEQLFLKYFNELQDYGKR